MFLVSGLLLIGTSYFVGEATMNLFRPLGYISWAMSVIFGLIGLWPVSYTHLTLPTICSV